MSAFKVLTRDEVSEANQEIFDGFKKKLGFVPNLYATYAHSDTALADYLALQNRKSSLSAKEREIVNLAVSQVNACEYCLAAHTALGKMNGFTEDEILELRQGHASFNEKYNALAAFVRNSVINRGRPDEKAKEDFFAAGYTKENLVDTILIIGDKTISNFLFGTTQIPVDFPEAQPLEAELV